MVRKLFIPPTVSVVCFARKRFRYMLISGPSGFFIQRVSPEIHLTIDNNTILCFVSSYIFHKSNIVLIVYPLYFVDVIFRYRETLMLEGSHYKLQVSQDGKFVLVFVGRSHIHYYRIPFSIKVFVLRRKNTLLFSGVNRQKVQEFISLIKSIKRYNYYVKKGFKQGLFFKEL